jgi:hypothetical protein
MDTVENVMDTADILAAFSRAAIEFDVTAKNAGADIIGHAHALFFHQRKMSAAQIALEMENLRTEMRELNNAFTQLDFAHAAMTVGETASRIRAAAE